MFFLTLYSVDVQVPWVFTINDHWCMNFEFFFSQIINTYILIIQYIQKKNIRIAVTPLTIILFLGSACSAPPSRNDNYAFKYCRDVWEQSDFVNILFFFCSPKILKEKCLLSTRPNTLHITVDWHYKNSIKYMTWYSIMVNSYYCMITDEMFYQA